MSITKLRGKSALSQNDNNNKLTKSYVPQTALLKIEPFVPSLTARSRKPIHRSYSTLSTTYFKRESDSKHHRTGRHPVRDVLLNHHQRSKSSHSTSSVSQNGICHINRSAKEQEKMPDRINYDRRGLTAIPIFENEYNLRLLSLQHNLINVFHIPDDSTRPQHSIIEEVEEINVPKTILQENFIKPPRNGVLTKRSISPSPTLTPTLPNNVNSLNTSGTNGNLLKSTFVQKSIILNANYKYSLKRSKSFMTKNLSSIKQNLQKCSMINGKNLTSFESPQQQQQQQQLQQQQPLELLENDLEKDESGIDSLLKVRNNQFTPLYGTVFNNLVFLDLYDNQIEKISNLDGLQSLTVLLLGKNRIIDISGLASLKDTLRVLDLHGNKISTISNKINCLQELKSLNLAGNQIRQISHNDFSGLLNLKELNLKRNKIKRVYGFNHLTSLERLWVCHNDLHRVEDMSSIAQAINLQEVTIENNPVSLAGDCVSFLVSYLPNLIMLSQMPITEQVRRAAMAWRKNKELSDSNYSNLTSDVFNSIRREEVISNARTNWELLRSQQLVSSNKMTNSKVEVNVLSPQTVSSDKEKNFIHEPEPNNVANRNGRKIKITRISPDDKGNHRNNNELQDFFRLPPILKPYTNSNPPSEKTPSSGSSLGPNVDSSSSCYNSSDNEGEKEGNESPPEPLQLQVPQLNEQPTFECEEVYYEMDPTKQEFKEVMVIEDTTDSSSNISSNQNDAVEIPTQNCEDEVTPNKITSLSICKGNENNPNTDSNSQSDKNSNISTMSIRSESELSTNIIQTTNPSEKSIKIRGGASVNKRYMHGSLMRSQTAKPKPSNTTILNNNASGANNAAAAKVPKQVVEREREQGGDYLIEICGRYLNIYGLGALRFIDKPWNAQKAGDVLTLNFSYVNFNNIAAVLNRVKLRFPNAESFVFRETNISCLGQLNALAELQGITSLVIDPEGNSISSKQWRLYAVYRLSHWGLKTINGIEVTESEIELAQTEYLGLSDLVLWSLPELMLQPLLTRLRLDESCSASKLSAKEWLMKADQSLKIVVGKEALQWKKSNNAQEENNIRERGKSHFSVMIENTCNAVEKLQKLETLWPNLLLDIVRNTLLDYSQLDVYLKNVMTDVMK